MATAVLDLDHTILHMTKSSEMPANDAGFAEDVAVFEHLGVEYAVALRVGTTSLVRALKTASVRVVIVTCNLVADKVLAALSARCDVFADLECHIVESRERGAKSLDALGFPRSDNSRRIMIVDDSPSAWTPADQPLILEAKRYDVRELAAAFERDDDEADELLDAELGYLAQIREDLCRFFDGWNDDAGKITNTLFSPPEARSDKGATGFSDVLNNKPTSSDGADLRLRSNNGDTTSGFGPIVVDRDESELLDKPSQKTLPTSSSTTGSSGGLVSRKRAPSPPPPPRVDLASLPDAGPSLLSDHDAKRRALDTSASVNLLDRSPILDVHGSSSGFSETAAVRSAKKVATSSTRGFHPLLGGGASTSNGAVVA